MARNVKAAAKKAVKKVAKPVAPKKKEKEVKKGKKVNSITRRAFKNRGKRTTKTEPKATKATKKVSAPAANPKKLERKTSKGQLLLQEAEKNAENKAKEAVKKADLKKQFIDTFQLFTKEEKQELIIPIMASCFGNHDGVLRCPSPKATTPVECIDQKEKVHTKGVFTEEDDMNMIGWVIHWMQQRDEKGLGHGLTGYAIWEAAEKEGVTDRPWNSMRTRFKDRLACDADTFDEYIEKYKVWKQIQPTAACKVQKDSPKSTTKKVTLIPKALPSPKQADEVKPTKTKRSSLPLTKRARKSRSALRE